MNGRYRNIFFCSKNDYFTHYHIIAVKFGISNLLYIKICTNKLTLFIEHRRIILVKIAE